MDKSGNVDISGAVENLLDLVRIERVSLNKAKALYAREHAPEFNIFDIISPGETDISRLFRWMLDPRESHGQACTFVDLFFDHFLEGQSGSENWAEAVAECEVMTTVEAVAGRRMDIVLRSQDGTKAVVIENKPWAKWGDVQLEDYWLDQRHRATLVAFVGGVPDAQKEVESHWMQQPGRRHDFPADGSVIGVGYERVAAWIEACAKASTPPEVASVLRQFADYARVRVAQGGGPMVEITAVSRTIQRGGAQAMEAAFDIEAAMGMVRDTLAMELVAPLRERLPGWEINPGTARKNRMTGLTVSPPGLRGALVFHLFGPPGWTAWVGIASGSSRGLSGDQEGDYSATWRWWRWLSSDDIDPPDKLWKIERQALAQAIAKIARACVAAEKGLNRGGRA